MHLICGRMQILEKYCGTVFGKDFLSVGGKTEDKALQKYCCFKGPTEKLPYATGCLRSEKMKIIFSIARCYWPLTTFKEIEKRIIKYTKCN